MEKIECNVCHSEKVFRLLKTKAGQEIYECNNCKNAFTHPRPILPDYKNEDFHSNGEAKDYITKFEDLLIEIKHSYLVQKHLITKYTDTNDSILEIGGGEGIFTSKLSESRPNVEMVEPSLTAAMRASSRGINVINDFFDPSRITAQYRLVTLAHVLEHVEDPVEMLKQIKKILLPDGLILLTQTNFKGFMPWLLGGSWYAWATHQHYTHFSISGIKYIAKVSGFEFVELKYSRLYHSPSIYHSVVKYIPFFQDQIHVIIRNKNI